VDAIEREEATEEGGGAGVAVNGEAGGGDLGEEGVDVDEGGAGALGLLGDDLVEGGDLRLDGDDLGCGEDAGVGDGAFLFAAEDKGDLGEAFGVDEVAGGDAEGGAEVRDGEAGYGGVLGEDDRGGLEVGDGGDVGDVGDDEVGGCLCGEVLDERCTAR